VARHAGCPAGGINFFVTTMKTGRLLLFTLALTMTGLLAAHAQKDYNTGLGVRLSPTAGFTVKHFVSPKAAVEGIFSARWHGFLLHGLYEVHQDAFQTTNFNFYYGVGGHYGYWDVNKYPHPWYDERGIYSVFGVDGILGLEYTFREIPFSLSLDWKPMVNLINYTGFWGDDVGFSIRFNIK